MSGMPTPHIEYDLLLPLLIVFGTAVTGVLFEAFVARRARYLMQVLLAIGGLAAAFISLVAVGRDLPADGHITVLGAIAVDRPALVLQGIVLLVGIMAMVFIAERNIGTGLPRDRARRPHPLPLPRSAGGPGWTPSPRRDRRCRAAPPNSTRPAAG